MGKALDPPQGVGIAELRLKDYRGLQLVHQPALPGNAEFLGKIAVQAGNHLHGYCLAHTASFLSSANSSRSAQSSSAACCINSCRYRLASGVSG